jgi:hypothetical protein
MATSTPDGTGFNFPAVGFWPTGLSVASADFDLDQLADAITYNPGTGAYTVYHNTGSDFTLVTTNTAITGAKVFTSDLNGDGRPDVFFYNSTTGQWQVVLFGTNGQPASTTSGTVGSSLVVLMNTTRFP